MSFEIALIDYYDVPTYITIAEKALHLQVLKMNPNRIAAALGVDRATVIRALRWITGKSVHAKKPSQEKGGDCPVNGNNTNQ